jgi:hypothetical protein
VPLIVGYILSIAIFHGLDSGAVTGLVTVAITGLYYLAVRLLERVDSKFGWLLGYAAQPRYADSELESSVQKRPNVELQVKAVSKV